MYNCGYRPIDAGFVANGSCESDFTFPILIGIVLGVALCYGVFSLFPRLAKWLCIPDQMFEKIVYVMTPLPEQEIAEKEFEERIDAVLTRLDAAVAQVSKLPHINGHLPIVLNTDDCEEFDTQPLDSDWDLE
jgi:hypothetical protein